MQTMIHRTTFALDEKTAQRLKRLSVRWNVSQAEVVRRSVARADEAEQDLVKDPIALLNRLHASNQGMANEDAARYMKELRDDRKTWRAE